MKFSKLYNKIFTAINNGYIYRITKCMPCETKSPSNWFYVTIFTLPVISFYSKLSCNFIKMHLRGKCPLVNLLHIFGTPIRKYTTGGLFVGVVISMTTFLAWMHVYFISFDRINTVFCLCVFYFNLFYYYNLFTWGKREGGRTAPLP